MLAATVGAVLAGYAGQAGALDWQFENGAQLYWNTTISAGASW